MNERIKELERQATETVKCGLNGTSTTESFNRKKFAELIVWECAKVAKKVDGDEGDDYKSGRTWAGLDILKHFGVE